MCLEVLLKCGEEVALVQEISGVKRIVSTDHALEKLFKTSNSSTLTPTKAVFQKSEMSSPITTNSTPNSNAIHPSNVIPTVHIDIQIHISADAKPEQIEQIFESMARYLYNKG